MDKDVVLSTKVNPRVKALRGMLADNALISRLVSVTEGVKPVTNQYETVLVEISPHDSYVFAKFIEASYDSMASAVAMSGGKLGFTPGSYARYLVTLVNARAEYSATGRAIVRPMDMITVPAFMNIVMNQIGKCTNDDIGLMLVPKYIPHRPPSYDSKSEKIQVKLENSLLQTLFTEDEFTPETFDYMGREELENMSLKLRALRKFGFVMSEQPFDRSRDGDWEFMTLQVLNNAVMAMDTVATPVHAMLASVLNLKQVQSVMLPRVNYGPVTFFSSLIEAVASPVD